MIDVLPDLLTVPEVASDLRCSQVTVRRMIARGELRRVKVGRLDRIPRSEVERMKAGA